MKIDKFNIRVYGIVIRDEKILLAKENIDGFELVKLPGGGVEYGEGLIDALRREIKEELNSEVIEMEHFYTTDFFQRSAFKSKEQVIAIYFKIDLDNYPNDGFEITEPNHRMTFFWKALSELIPDHVTFPIDQRVIKMLIS